MLSEHLTEGEAFFPPHFNPDLNKRSDHLEFF